jgi:RNA polymerase sigma-70 factor (ECF subfamily)
MRIKYPNKKEFTVLLEQNTGIIHKVAMLYTHNKEDREDLYQDIYYQLWRSQGTYRQEAKFSTWMYRVAINTAISHIRKKKKLVVPIEHFQEPADDAGNADKEEQIQILFKAISQLNKIDKAIILLWLEEKSHEEIVDILGISKSNVSVKLVRIKQNLTERMKGSKR